jgi:hypothetical protein
MKISDHNPTMLTIRTADNIKHAKRHEDISSMSETPARPDFRRLATDKDLAKKLSDAMDDAVTPILQKHHNQSSPQLLYNEMSIAMDQVCDTIIPKEQRRKIVNTWFDENKKVLKRLSHRVKGRIKIANPTESEELLTRMAVRRLQRAMRKAKTKFWVKVSDEINLAFTKNDHRGFYNLVKQTHAPSSKALHAGYVGASGAVFKPGTDELTTTPEEARQVWHSHFTSVLAVPVVLTPFKPIKFDGKRTREADTRLSVEQLIPQIREFKLLR